MIPIKYRTKPLLASIFLVGMMVLISASTVYFIFFEPAYLYYRNVPFPALSQRVEQGQPVSLVVLRCNTSSTTRSYDITRSLVNHVTGATTLLVDTRVTVAPGCSVAISRVNIVTNDTPPGTYSVWGMARAQGTFRTHVIPWQSQPFEVVARKPDPIPVVVPTVIIIKGAPGKPGPPGPPGVGKTGPAGAAGSKGKNFWGG